MAAFRQGSNERSHCADIGYKKNPSAYDLVIIGSPVWAGKMSSPTRAYISRHKDHFKQVAFFLTCGGEGNEPVFVGMEKLSNKKPLATLAVTEADIKSGKYIEKVKEFVEKISQSSKLKAQN